MMTLEINPPRADRRRDGQRGQVTSRNLVVVASESRRSRNAAGHARNGRIAGPNGLQWTSVAAHVVGSSAAWSRRLSRHRAVSPRFDEPIGPAPASLSDLPDHVSGLLDLMEQAHETHEHQEAITEAIVALQAADAVITGPFSTDDANSPGLLPHLADLANRAYRALRPPRELIVHPAFGQVARRFQYIQMSEQEARLLGAGARDLGILAERLRRLQGDAGEFAITSFASRGLLWADDAWWEIDLIDGAAANESVAGAVFCLAWVVARRFRRVGAAEALAYARAATAAANQAR
jgi:hypothetical protein